MTLKIGVSACFFYPDPKRTVFGHKMLVYLERDMANYLARPGVMPILIPDLDAGNMESFLAEIDGFVFQGGDDIAPESYREPPIDAARWPGNKYRDEYELRIMDFAFKDRKPILGICRGCQLINIYFGGTLYQDLLTQKSGALVHRDAEVYDRVHHGVDLESGGLLGEIYKRASLEVNSVHHQAIKEVGRGLKVEAVSHDDGVVEAVSFADAREKFILGVQWHPEFSYKLQGSVADPKPLYDRFLEEVRSKEPKT